MNIPDIQKKLRKFAEERKWEQFHSPKNLSMALAANPEKPLHMVKYWQIGGNLNETC